MPVDNIIDPKRRHLDFIDALLKEGLAAEPEALVQGFFHRPKDSFFRMPLGWRKEARRQPKKFSLSQPRNDFVEILRRGLGHIAANPSVPANVMAMSLAYRFPQEVDLEVFDGLGLSGEIRVVNEDEEAARKFFVEELGGAARRASEDFRQRLMGASDIDTSTDAIFRSDKYLLIGERGVGKTFFLNYLISQFTSDLHKDRVIVVRLDLTKDVDPNLSVDEWLNWKICKILFSYYDIGSFEQDAEHDATDPKFLHLIEKENYELLFDLRSDNETLFRIAKTIDTELTRVEFRETFREAAAKLRSKVDLLPVKIQASWFAPMIWDYIVNVKGCSILAIFDGLDQLGLTDHDVERYHRLVAAVNTYLGTEKSLYTASLVTMRPKSWIDRIGDDNFRSVFEEVAVASSQNDQILEQKKGYYSKPNFFKGRHEVVDTLGANYPESISKFASAFLDFVTLSLTRSVSITLPEFSGIERARSVGYSILEQLFGHNKRKTFQALSDVAKFFTAVLSDDFERMLEETVNVSDFFENSQPGSQISLDLSNPYSDVMRYNYLVVEALMLESPKENFRQEKYGYAVTEEGEIESASKSDQSINHYLHNIFHYVSNPSRVEFSHALLGVRILQFAKLNPTFEKSSLVSFLNEAFHYDSHVINQKFMELREDGLIEHKLDAPHVLVDSYAITFVGRYTMDRLVHSIEYLCMCLQTTPLPKSLIEIGMFPVRPHSSSEFVVYNKICSVINFLRFVNVVDRHEGLLFSEYIKNASDENKHIFSNRGFDDCFAISETMKISISVALKRIIEHAHDAELTQQISQLDITLANDASDLTVREYFDETSHG